MAWQRHARLVIATVGVACVGAVAWQYKARPAEAPAGAIDGKEADAVVHLKAGVSSRTSFETEQGRVWYEELTQYSDGSRRMSGVRVETVREGGRVFTIAAKEAFLAKGETSTEMTGGVEMTDGADLKVVTDNATYSEAEGVVRAPGRLDFTRGRMRGSATGFVYNKNADILNLLAEVRMRMYPTENGTDALSINSGTAEFNRPAKEIRFTGHMKAVRDFETMEADEALARLSDDEQQLTSLDMKGTARIIGSRSGAGAMRGMSGAEINLKYAPDGTAIERALLRGGARVAVAGAAPRPAGRGGRGNAGASAPAPLANREIAANVLDISLGPDGSTLTSLIANETVQLLIPAEGQDPSRTITSQSMEGKGDEQQGLTAARFNGNVQFRERGGKIERTASSTALDVSLSPGLGSIEEARFSHNVKFVEGKLTAAAAAAKYVLGPGTLQLSGSEPGAPMPSMNDERISVDAPAMDITLEGPQVKATGNIKSSLRPEKKGEKSEGAQPAPKMPSMLKEGEVIYATARELAYDGNSSKAVYTGDAQLWQNAPDAPTRIKGGTISIDQKSGDLTASGGVSTTTMMVREEKDKKRVREQSNGASKDFRYEEAARRATYTGDAKLIGPQGDLTAAKIELYLRESGDEVDRAVANGKVIYIENKRKTTGEHLDFFSQPTEHYILTGAPVVTVDECGRQNTGAKLIYDRATDTMTVSMDGREVTRTQTKASGSKCP